MKKIDRIWFETRMFFQTLSYGFCEKDLWSLDSTFAKFILPRLKAFRSNLHGCPGGLTHEQWEEAIDKMIWSMEYITKQWELNHNKTAKEELANDERCQEGLDLFGKWFRGLWD